MRPVKRSRQRSAERPRRRRTDDARDHPRDQTRGISPHDQKYRTALSRAREYSSLVVALARRRGDRARRGALQHRRVVARHRVAAAGADVGREVELRGDRVAQADADLGEVLRRRVRRRRHPPAGRRGRRAGTARTGCTRRSRRPARRRGGDRRGGRPRTTVLPSSPSMSRPPLPEAHAAEHAEVARLADVLDARRRRRTGRCRASAARAAARPPRPGWGPRPARPGSSPRRSTARCRPWRRSRTGRRSGSSRTGDSRGSAGDRRRCGRRRTSDRGRHDDAYRARPVDRPGGPSADVDAATTAEPDATAAATGLGDLGSDHGEQAEGTKSEGKATVHRVGLSEASSLGRSSAPERFSLHCVGQPSQPLNAGQTPGVMMSYTPARDHRSSSGVKARSRPRRVWCVGDRSERFATPANSQASLTLETLGP